MPDESVFHDIGHPGFDPAGWNLRQAAESVPIALLPIGIDEQKRRPRKMYSGRTLRPAFWRGREWHLIDNWNGGDTREQTAAQDVDFHRERVQLELQARESSSWAAAAELALGKDLKKIEKRLARFRAAERETEGKTWRRVDNRLKNGPHFLYDSTAVKHLIY